MEGKSRVNDKRGVGILLYIIHIVILGVLLHIIEHVVDHATDEGDIRARPQWSVDISFRRGAGETRVNVNKFGSRLHCFFHPFKRYGVVLSGIGADNQNAVSVPDINPVIGHCPSAETFRQTGDSGGMSEAGTVFQINHAQGAVHLGEQVALLVIQLPTTKAGDDIGSVCLGIPVLVAGGFNSAGDGLYYPVPRFLFPVG